jgi:hypothetical protein
MGKSAFAFLVVLGVASSGCTATVRAPAPAVAIEAEYTPLYYNRHVVFYDDFGAPYYYVGGRVYYVPRTSPHYHSYVRHYHAYGPAYQRWHRRHYPIYHRDRVPAPRYHRDSVPRRVPYRR